MCMPLCVFVCVCGVESITHTLAWLEQKPDIIEVLVCVCMPLCVFVYVCGVESITHTLAWLEQKPDIIEVLVCVCVRVWCGVYHIYSGLAGTEARYH